MTDRAQSDVSERNVNEKEFLLQLISLYREFPHLWKLRSKDYTDNTKRCQAIKKKMVKVLRISRLSITEEDVNEKNEYCTHDL